jgi:hypothetical protein
LKDSQHDSFSYFPNFSSRWFPSLEILGTLESLEPQKNLIGTREGVGRKSYERLLIASLEEKSDICVCVSEEFDMYKVTKTILEAITLSPCYVTDLNQLQQWEWELTKRVFNGKEVSTCFK